MHSKGCSSLTLCSLPQWTYRTLFLSNDSMFHTIDKMCLEFVLITEGMERNSDDVNKFHNVLHVPAPLARRRAPPTLDVLVSLCPICDTNAIHTPR